MTSKRTHMLLQLIVAVALLVVLTRTWVTYVLVDGAAAVPSVSVTGQRGLPALLPVSIALIAMAITLGIAGRVLRVIIGVFTVLLGVWVAVASGSVGFGDAQAMLGFASGELQEATGLAGAQLTQLVADTIVGPWPMIAAIIGAVVALLGGWTTVVGWSWSRGGAKYETGAGAKRIPAGDRIAEWDALSGGADPSDNADDDGSPNSSQTR